MKISVVIPVYNQAEYLNDAIDSVMSQNTLRELIIVDDGSTDGSGDIAESRVVLGAPIIKVIHQVNKGLSSARNTGIMNATGQYIQFLDADDMLVDGALKKIKAKIRQTKADIIAPSFKCFGVQNNEVILNSPLALKDFEKNNRMGYFGCVKKSVLLEIGGYSPRMTYGYEDLHIWIDLLKRGKTVEVIQEPLILYRTKEHSMIHDAQKHHDELMAQIKKDHPELYA